MNTATTLIEGVQPSASPGRSMEMLAVRGAYWTIVFSVLTKLVTVSSQVALAWFLLPREMGLVALTLSMTCIASAFSASSLQRVLIQRPESNDQEVRQVFWLSLTMNLFGATLLALASPAAAALFGEPHLAGLIRVVAVAILLQALPTIYSAAIYRRLQFRMVAMIHFGQGLLQNLLAVTLAAAGCGAYSLVWPMIGAALFSALAFRRAGGRIEVGAPCPKMWPALLTDAAWLMANAVFTALQAYGAGFMISLIHDSKVAGFYYWGFLVSSQAVFLVGANLQSVLFPLLAKLNSERGRQYQAFHKACRILATATVPVCVAQILVARPLIEWVFHDRWLPAIPVVQWLSLGLLTQPLGILAGALLLARGEYRKVASVTAGLGLAAIMAAALGSRLGHEAEIACMVSVTLLIANAAAGCFAYRQFGAGCRGLMESVAPALALGFVVLSVGGGLAHFVPHGGPLLRTLALGLYSFVAYGVLVKAFLPQAADEVIRHFRTRGATDAKQKELP